VWLAERAIWSRLAGSRRLGPLLICVECWCVTEEARAWIAEIAEDPEEPDAGPYVIAYCPPCAEREFDRAPAFSSSDGSTDGDGRLPPYPPAPIPQPFPLASSFAQPTETVPCLPPS
jgi:hypothetical protein